MSCGVRAFRPGVWARSAGGCWRGRGMVLPLRIELRTSPLPRECSTTELRQQIGGCRRSRQPVVRAWEARRGGHCHKPPGGASAPRKRAPIVRCWRPAGRATPGEDTTVTPSLTSICEGGSLAPIRPQRASISRTRGNDDQESSWPVPLTCITKSRLRVATARHKACAKARSLAGEKSAGCAMVLITVLKSAHLASFRRALERSDIRASG